MAKALDCRGMECPAPVIQTKNTLETEHPNVIQILVDKGFVSRFINIEDDRQGLLRIYLKYLPGGNPVIRHLERASRPGLRYYVGAEELPRVRNGLGVAILSTSRGVMTDKEARAAHIGGEVLAYVY